MTLATNRSSGQQTKSGSAFLRSSTSVPAIVPQSPPRESTQISSQQKPILPVPTDLQYSMRRWLSQKPEEEPFCVRLASHKIQSL